MRFLEKHPGTFHKLPYKRNNVESVSQSAKERFGGVARAVETNTRHCVAVHVHMPQRGFRTKATARGRDGPLMRGDIVLECLETARNGAGRPFGT